MSRLLVHVEGETEEAFVYEVLAPHLYGCGYLAVTARIVGNARLRSRRGGIRSWISVRADILRHLKEDQGCLATTMVDYYALPSSGHGAWPGRAVASGQPYPQKANTIETALLADIVLAGGGAHPQRFIPYIMMHEFEGLLFSDCQRFASAIGSPGLGPNFQNIRDQFDSPEEINDSAITAPSKRVIALVEEYSKPLHGNVAIIDIGLTTIRQECPHFDSWITALEEWVN